MTIQIPFDNSYARLPEAFYRKVAPTPVGAPRLVALNRRLAAELGLDPDALSGEAGAAAFSGNAAPAGSEPIATAYAGHQFGQFVPQLGDGRAILLGEVVGVDGGRRDIQLKGAGATPFSRRGDGRAALGPILREYLVSEAMAALGVPTTRALAAVTTGEAVYRDRPLPGAVLTRVASSHIRVGTFQYFAARGQVDALKALVDHVVERHYPELEGRRDKALGLLEAVVERQARLVAQWMGLGFVHGVMNTDNCSIAGETIDYGPCAFIDAFDPNAVFSSIDAYGRYAYSNQPGIAQWNLTRLAECLLPLIAEDGDEAVRIATGSIEGFAPAFEAASLSGYRAKFGLARAEPDDGALVQGLLARMADARADFTLTFRALGAFADGSAPGAILDLFDDHAPFLAWGERYRARLAQDGVDPAERRTGMDRTNPAIIPRNHQVEAVIEAAVEEDDFGPFERFALALSDPFNRAAERSPYAAPRPDDAGAYRTFCGT